MMEQKGIKSLVTSGPPRSQELDAGGLENYIRGGMSLISSGQYNEAIKYFRNNEVAKQAGYRISLGNHAFIGADSVLDEADINTIANQVALGCFYIPHQKVIQIGGVAAEQIEAVPSKLMHNVALLHVEEWLHALQFKRGSPLVQNLDKEIDVAEFLIKNQVPVTPEFMARYDRGLYLTGDNGRDDSEDRTPSIRRGVFIRVRRSDGQVDDNWQITGFDNDTGDIRAVSFEIEGSDVSRMERLFPRQEVFQLNREGVHPFEEATSFGELFHDVSSKVKMVVSGINQSGLVELREYKSKEIIGIINQVREGKLTADYIPRSGGLRNKVIDLLKAA